MLFRRPDRHLNPLDFEAFVRQNHTQRETEMEPTTKLLAELVRRGVDIWKQEDGVLTQNDAATVALRDHFCSVSLPLASNSQFAEAGVKEAKIFLTTGRNEELHSVCAISRSFLFEKLKPRKNTPDRVVQILSVAIEQNEIHEKETTKSGRKERRKQVTSALREDHFRNARLEKKQQKISAKGSEDKADNVTQKSDGTEDAPFLIDGKTQCGKL
jgi:hypothetical protein